MLSIKEVLPSVSRKKKIAAEKIPEVVTGNVVSLFFIYYFKTSKIFLCDSLKVMMKAGIAFLRIKKKLSKSQLHNLGDESEDEEALGAVRNFFLFTFITLIFSLSYL